MSFWSVISSKLKEIFSKMIGARTIEKTLHVTPIISTQMEEAINLWSDMYKNKAPWIHEPSTANTSRVVSLGLPALIASEKARMAVLEMKSEITTPTKSVEIDNPDYVEPQVDEFGNLIPTSQPKTIMEDRPVGDTTRAEYLNSQYTKLKKNIRRQLEYGIAKGGLVIKPYVVINKGDNVQTTADIEFDYIQADAFYPLAFDASGNITEMAFIDTETEKDTIYRRLEYHKFENNTVQVINRAFKSSSNRTDGDMNGLDLGQEVPLTSVARWKDLEANTVIKDVERPLFGYFKMPEANTIDTSSPLGVSGYSRATSLIKDADMQYSRLLWEYEAGEMAVNVQRDAFQWLTDESDTDKGHSRLGEMQQRLYRQIDVENDDLFQPYAPALRDASYSMGLNTILMRIEDVCAISRGTLSDATQDAKTATELKILKTRSYSANAEIQQALEDCLQDVIYVMNAYCTLYNITPEGEYDTSFEWDDSILVDIDSELSTRLTLMQNGLAGKVETRMWYFGETERQAREALMEIEEENMQDMERNLIEQANMLGMQARSNEE